MSGAGNFINRQNLLIGLLFLLLIIVTVLTGQQEDEVVYDPNSVGPMGLRGLLLWLNELGYEVDQRTTKEGTVDAFQVGDDVDLLFIYPNSLPYTDEEAQAVYHWVEAGGTLVMIGPSTNDHALEEAFGVYLAEKIVEFDAELEEQPLLPDREDDEGGFGVGDHLVLDNAPNALPVLSTDRKPDLSRSTEAAKTRTAMVALQQIGDGVVWHLAPRHDLTNLSLHDENEARLVPPLLRTVPMGGRVLLDTYHLFRSPTREGQIDSIQAWFYQTAAGRAIIFAFLTIFGYLLLQGRRLGPPLPNTEGVRRREAAEFVRAMAGLQQRSHQHAATAQYHKQRLLAAVGQRYAIPSRLPDQEFLEQLALEKAGPTQAQMDQIRSLLQTLSADPNEAMLVQAVAQIDEIIDSR